MYIQLSKIIGVENFVKPSIKSFKKSILPNDQAA